MNSSIIFVKAGLFGSLYCGGCTTTLYCLGTGGISIITSGKIAGL
jgi:hypothetical protein